jgi:hypothetical protein
MSFLVGQKYLAQTEKNAKQLIFNHFRKKNFRQIKPFLDPIFIQQKDSPKCLLSENAFFLYSCTSLTSAISNIVEQLRGAKITDDGICTYIYYSTNLYLCLIWHSSGNILKSVP